MLRYAVVQGPYFRGDGQKQFTVECVGRISLEYRDAMPESSRSL